MERANKKATVLAGTMASKIAARDTNHKDKAHSTQQLKRLQRIPCRSICRGFAVYEARKAAWKDQHPDATPAQWDAAIRRIARECGV